MYYELWPLWSSYRLVCLRIHLTFSLFQPTEKYVSFTVFGPDSKTLAKHRDWIQTSSHLDPNMMYGQNPTSSSLKGILVQMLIKYLFVIKLLVIELENLHFTFLGEWMLIDKYMHKNKYMHIASKYIDYE